jgi:hypothetical protein
MNPQSAIGFALLVLEWLQPAPRVDIQPVLADPAC